MAKKRDYCRIEPDKLIGTIDALQQRIASNLGERGLTRVSRELLDVAREAVDRAENLQRANWGLRLVPYATTALIVYLTWLLTQSIGDVESKLDKLVPSQDLRDLVRALKQLMSNLALPIAIVVPIPVVIAVFSFIWSLESRWKRRRTLRYLHELRSIIHVIDMHQLTKDPYRISDDANPDFVGGRQLVRYLDHCAELLSLSAKVAALYAEATSDPVVIATVSDLGQITSNLSNKIWQKLNIAERGIAAAA